MASRVAVLLLLGVICVGLASAEIVVDCCLKVAEKPLPLTIIQSYAIQEGGNGCEISATAFITKSSVKSGIKRRGLWEKIAGEQGGPDSKLRATDSESESLPFLFRVSE
ncbi:hypothetical protein PFLUV_G00074980 [Perca fluviatilis]|uniref:Chemokine interleukin-8-like domain-containing protein n=1 Tax=Perca fluviatilis TaxID=8168 RepID=A0A6A5EJU1_PERFL|nr:hypothetical protein PFLUV_G00074980 [Perca fluviatilis]